MWAGSLTIWAKILAHLAKKIINELSWAELNYLTSRDEWGIKLWAFGPVLNDVN
jgi:hypothetical protein